MDSYDIAVIGAGVIGNAAARELSKTDLSVVVLEQEADTAFGISSRNSGVLHSGIHYAPGTLRARFDVEGNRLMEPLCSALSVPCIRTGKLTVAAQKDEIASLERLHAQGEANGVPGLRLIDPPEMQKLQPGIAGVKALHSPTSGIINPISLTIALAEHAHFHGVSYRFLHEVTEISHQPNPVITCRTPEGSARLQARLVINCAGLQADHIAGMTGYTEHPVYPCRGEYYVLDKRLESQLNLLIYPVPGAHSAGLGVHLTKTTEGNILIGPSSEYIDDRDDCASTSVIMERLKAEGRALLPDLETGDFIRSFSGIRPKLTPPEVGGYGDFIITRQDTMIHLLGIESPGLTSAPAIARHLCSMVDDMLNPTYKSDWDPSFPETPGIYRRPYPASSYSFEQRRELIEADEDFASMVCRCEEISKAEVLSALRRIIGPVTIAGIKQRCRTMTGRCQGGFCLPRIADILQQEGCRPWEMHYKGPDSPMFTGYLREPGGVL